jgi:hypothetical protein
MARFMIGHRFAFEKFKVYTEGRGSKYYTVYVFADKHAMLTYYHAQCEKTGSVRWTKFEAICQHWKWLGRAEKRKHARDIGCVLFHLGFIGSGVVSHEMTHAAMFWRRKRHSDERLCLVQGELVRQFWLNYYRLNLHRRTRLRNV